MKAYPKIVQADRRGQIIIPKPIRDELSIEEGAAFWVYNTKEGIVLKRIKDIPNIKSSKRGVKNG